MRTHRLRVAGDPAMRIRPAVVPATAAVRAVIHVRLAPDVSRPRFEQQVKALPAVVCAWQVTGDVDYELLVACVAISGLDGVLSCLHCYGGLEVTSVGLVLREVSGPGAADPVAATREGEVEGGD